MKCCIDVWIQNLNTNSNANAFQTNLKLQPTTGVPDRLRSGTGPTLLQVRVV